jgi:hypothetical protein
MFIPPIETNDSHFIIPINGISGQAKDAARKKIGNIKK